MLANIGNLINEKLKCMQLQLRARDERITALETENAMLYLKLAQSQGLIYDGRVKAAHQKRLHGFNTSQQEYVSEVACELKQQVVALKSDLEKLKGDTRDLPRLLDFNMCTKQEKTGFQDAFRVLTQEATATNEKLHKTLCQTEASLCEAKQRAEEERVRRKDLHNMLVELRGNIRVYCRVRPLLASLDSNNDPNILGLPGTQSEQIIEAVDDENVSFNYVNNPSTAAGGKTKRFEFERVFGTKDQQGPVFAEVAPLLTSLLDGYNVCIMAYGQTGSGKTHTMLGTHAPYSDVAKEPGVSAVEDGVIPRSAREILRLIKERESATETYSLEVSVFEIYNNEIVDLLLPTSQRGVKHAVFSDSDGSQEIPTLTARPIATAEELMKYVVFGLLHRHEDSTKIHAHSSRSHLIVQLNIYRTNFPKRCDTKDVKMQPTACNVGSVKNKPPLIMSEAAAARGTRSNIPSPTTRSKSPRPGSGRKACSRPSSPALKKTASVDARPTTRSPSPPLKKTTGCSGSMKNLVVKTKLQLVDLAGSECVGMSGVTGSAFRETSNINRSLSALADVLQALAENQTHIPYRNTKLTHVLQDTIGGDSKLLVMLCVSPVQKYSTESLQGLGFGARARQVARGPVKKRRPAGLTIQLPNLCVDIPQSSVSPRTSPRASPRNMSPVSRSTSAAKH